MSQNPLNEINYCPECGNEINSQNLNFCPHCGYNISQFRDEPSIEPAYSTESEGLPTKPLSLDEALEKVNKQRFDYDVLAIIGGIISLAILFFPLAYIHLELLDDYDSGMVLLVNPNTYVVREGTDIFTINPMFLYLGGVLGILGGILGIVGGAKNRRGIKIISTIASIAAFIIIILFSVVIMPQLAYSRATTYDFDINDLIIEINPLGGTFIPLIGGIFVIIGMIYQWAILKYSNN